MPLGMEVGLGPGDTVLDGDSASPKRAQPPISAHVYCGLTAVSIRILLGMEVDFSLGDIVLDGDSVSPSLKVHSSPNFRPISVVGKRLVD